MHRGEELLGRRRGLRAYVAEQSTVGIPLLHPWANRLERRRFSLSGREVDLDIGSLPLSTDPNGLPIHGLLAGASAWRVERHEQAGDGAALVASFDLGADAELIRAFPFPHEVNLEAVMSGPTLTITTSVRATGAVPVPVSFGFHPYLRLPGLERSAWEIEVPVRDGLTLDAQMLPTGSREPVTVEPGALGSRSFDNAYVAPPDSLPFVLSGGGRRIEVRFEFGYPFAQMYAPLDDDVVAFEPMTAPTNAVRRSERRIGPRIGLATTASTSGPDGLPKPAQPQRGGAGPAPIPCRSALGLGVVPRSCDRNVPWYRRRYRTERNSGDLRAPQMT